MYKLIATLLFTVFSQVCVAQFLPKDGSALNYTLIGFSFPGKQGYNKYTIEIAEGNLVNDEVFSTRVIRSFQSSETKAIAQVPSFGRQYTWRVVYTNGQSTKLAGTLHHFHTLYLSNADTTLYRIKVIKNNEAYKNSFFFADANRTLYDMNGTPIWFLPDINGPKPIPRDIKLTQQGKITFLLEDFGAYEIDYNGNIVWKANNSGAVSGEKQEYYNHELTRLANGHYMTLGKENVLWELPGAGAKKYDLTDSRIVYKYNRFYQKIEFGTAIEYDEKGNVVWSWKSSTYFKNSDLCKRMTDNGLFDIENVHENSLFLDEQAKIFYMGFRNISRILKVTYPDGKVVAEYGKKYTGGTESVVKNDLFCDQHCCRHSDDGLLYLVNNNDCNFPAPPKILMLKEPTVPGETLAKTWEYECNIMDAPSINGRKPKSGGGSVFELPDHSFFACVNYLYTGIFVIDRDKNIKWSAVSEAFDIERKAWMPNYQYRTFMITRAELENLIWSAETK